MTTEISIEEEERQMIVLALAHLAAERPGWLAALRDINTKFQPGSVECDFEQLMRWRLEQIAAERR